MAEAVAALQAKTGKTYTSLMEQAVNLLLEQRGVDLSVISSAGDDPAAIEAARAKAAEEKARIEAEKKDAAAREKLTWSWKHNAEYNEHCKRQGIMPLGRDHYLPTNAEEQAIEDARKAAEKAEKEGSFV